MTATMNLLIDRPPWMADALCAETDPDAFFPEQGASVAAAKAVCARCLLQAKCLDYALANGERFGVWGGTSEKDRQAMRPRRRRSGREKAYAASVSGHLAG